LEAANYYIIDSCTGEYARNVEFDNLLTQLGEGVAGISSLKKMLDEEPDTILAACDNANPQRLTELSVVMEDSFGAFTQFVNITNKAADVLECSRINSIFVDFYHDALCTSGPYSVMWMFATMMAVFGLGMIIVLFRGALLPTEHIYVGEASEHERGDEDFYSEKIGASQDQPLSNSKEASETDDASRVQDDASHVQGNDDKLVPAVLYDDDQGSKVRGYDFENDAGVPHEEDDGYNRYA